MSYSSLGIQLWYALTRDHTVLPATHTFIHRWDQSYLPLKSVHFISEAVANQLISNVL